MARVEPLRALRYDTASAGALDTLIAPPYDVISPAGRDELAAKSPRNIVHLTLAADEADAGPMLRDWRDVCPGTESGGQVGPRQVLTRDRDSSGSNGGAVAGGKR